MTTLTSMCEMVCKFFQKKQEEKRIEEEQAANARYWRIPACCDDDDDYDSAITPVLSTEEPEDIRLTKRLLYDNSSPCLSREFISENSNAEIEYFSPSPILVEDNDSLMEEIDLSFTPDDPMLPGIKEDDYDSKRDILILEDLLDNYSLSLPKNESFHFDIPSSSRPPAKPPYGNT
nr:hypothetical protein [Tanacetum cinerariifolium]